MSITREQIRELAEFQDPQSCALSFYFQPSTPRNKAHKEDVILIKDLAREAMRKLESEERKALARADMDRILRLSGELRSNGTMGKPYSPAPPETSGASMICLRLCRLRSCL